MRVLQNTFSLLHPVNVNDMVQCAIRPSVDASAILLSSFPYSFEFLSAWIVQGSNSMTFIILELSFIDLAIRPVEFAFTRFLAARPLTFVKWAISPLEVSLSVHLVVAELALENFSLWSYTTTVSMSLPLSEIALIDWAIWKDFNALSIRFPWCLVNFSSELSTWLSLVESVKHSFLLIGTIVTFYVYLATILVIVKRAKLFVNSCYHWVLVSVKNVFIILQWEGMISLWE